jgi:hypothetical protein
MNAHSRTARALCDKALIQEEQLNAVEMAQLETALRETPLDELRLFMEKWRMYLVPENVEQVYRDRQAALPVLRMAEAVLDVRERNRGQTLSDGARIRALRRGVRQVIADECINLIELAEFFRDNKTVIRELETLAGQARPSGVSQRRLRRLAAEVQLSLREIAQGLMSAAFKEARATHRPLHRTPAFFEALYTLNGLDPNLRHTGNMSENG